MEPKYIRTIFKFLLYFILLLINNVYEFFVRIFCGHIPTGKVRLRKVLLRYKFDLEELSRTEDFLLSPGIFVEPASLDHPNWHIYCIDENLVTFVYLKSSIDKYSIVHYPFMFVPVHTDAIQVAQLSHDDFIKLANTFEQKSQPKTVLFTNTARCGSTLMAKMLHRPGKSICYGEPHCLTNLAIMDNAESLSPERMKSVHTPKNEICVLKTTSGEARLVKYCDDVPNLKHMFMFRKSGLLSVERMLRREETICFYFLHLFNLNHHLTRFVGNVVCMEREQMLKCRPKTIKVISSCKRFDNGGLGACGFNIRFTVGILSEKR
ncbi:unnamed protein product [Auanema sp. JU1783]|nr:unnamed protein product [Auanema sp. JU1783]